MSPGAFMPSEVAAKPVAEWLKDEISRLEGSTHPFAVAYRNELEAQLADEPRKRAQFARQLYTTDD